MNVIEFLLELKELHIFVNMQGDKVTVKGDRAALTAELKQRLVQLKAQIIELYQKLGLSTNSQLAPTSFAQQRLWFIDQFEGNTVHYNMPMVLVYEGNLNVDALNRAYNRILQRHDSLRTVFISMGEEPYQVIKDFEEVTVTVEDLTHLTGQQLDEQVQLICHQESHRQFKLDCDLMLSWRLLKVAADKHIEIRNLHHIAADGWSVGVLNREFNVLYTAHCLQQPESLEPLAIQYADYAHWQRKWLQGEVLEKQMNHWLEQLQGIPAVHSLPTDRPRSTVQTHSGGVHGSRIDGELIKTFTDLCFEHGATLFMGLHALLSLLFSRYSGQSDIVIGTPIANREQPDVAPLVGFFVNTIVLRSQPELCNNFLELLEQSKNTALGAYGHQQVPFEQLVNQLNCNPSLSYSPVFQIMMVLQNNESVSIDLPELTVSSADSCYTDAKFELTVNFTQDDGHMWIGWNYNADLFDVETMWRYAANIEVLLRAVVEHPTMALPRLPVVNDDEYRHCVMEFNQRQIEYDKTATVQQLFESHAEATPDAPAVITEQGEYSYALINEQANKLAHLLRAKGVGSNDLVGVCLPRMADMVVCVLAILKAGGAYMPIDADYPKQRIEQMCEDANLTWVLTHSLVNFEHQLVQQCLVLDQSQLQSEMAPMPATNPVPLDNHNGAEQLAYVIFTSGSTGIPKGVMISQRNLYAYYVAANDCYGVGPGDRVMQFSSFAFDIFVEEMFCALCSGAALVFRNDEVLAGQQAFWQFVRSYRITAISLPTAFWHELCTQLDGGLLDSGELRLLITGGEAMSASMLKRWQQNMPKGIRLINTYGPTETTVVATYFDVTDYSGQHGSIPIGLPYGNIQCYVLNDAMQVCPVGVEGQLYIAGDGVAQGYLNQTELTAERFVVNPFDPASEGLLYRTGDVVKRLLDGNLEFVGRTDNQVKIRGFRIELGEIENQLATIDVVNSSRVFALDVGTGYKSIVAYIMLQQHDPQLFGETVESIKIELQSRLPDYMMPNSYTLVEHWPLTVHGKLDVAALPEPDLGLGGQYVAAQTELEQKMVDIWAELLALQAEQLSTTADFFDLGGHSLLAVRLVTQLALLTTIPVSIKMVFEFSNIQALCRVIESMEKQRQVAEQLEQAEDDDIEEIQW